MMMKEGNTEMTSFHKEWPVKGLSINLPDYSLHWVVEKKYSNSRTMVEITQFRANETQAGGGTFRFMGDKGEYLGSSVFEKYHYIGPVEQNF